MKMSEKKPEDKNKVPKTASLWELIISALGLILVVGTIGLTLFKAFTDEPTPQKLLIIVDSTLPNGDGYLVKFRVKNEGNQTAAAVTIEGDLKNGEESAETSSATLSYAPANSEGRGGLYFKKNPQQYNLQIRVTGYEEP